MFIELWRMLPDRVSRETCMRLVNLNNFIDLSGTPEHGLSREKCCIGIVSHSIFIVEFAFGYA